MKNKQTIELVAEFHKAAGHVPPAQPTVTNKEVNDFRIKLMAEEFYELQQALNRHDLIEAFDALLDLQYVLDGTFIQLGFAPFKTAGFDEVHRSNMTKDFPEPGVLIPKKITKGLKYSPPDLKKIIDI